MTEEYDYKDGRHTVRCPYCNAVCEADFVDVSVGFVQCGPFHCTECLASEIGPNDDPRELTEAEKKSGWYGPDSEPGSSANVIGGRIVSHTEAKEVYQAMYPFSATDAGREFIRKRG